MEIDEVVVNTRKQHLPNVANGAGGRAKVKLKIEDGFEFLKTDDSAPYDLSAIVDSSDPGQGPNGLLFRKGLLLLVTKLRECIRTTAVLEVSVRRTNSLHAHLVNQLADTL